MFLSHRIISSSIANRVVRRINSSFKNYFLRHQELYRVDYASTIINIVLISRMTHSSRTLKI